MSRSGRTTNVTLPSVPVGSSGGVVVTTGVERRNTSAPLTARPRVSTTRTRTVNGAVRERIALGVNTPWSIRSRSGSETAVTATVLPAPPAVVTTDVVVDVDELAPPAFEAVTSTRSVLPTSAACTV